MPLTDVYLRTLKGDVAKKHFDGKGLYLQVTAKGSKSWRMKYRIQGREKVLTFGLYPETSLKAAREKLTDARRLLAQGIDPSAERQAERASVEGRDTFEYVAREWMVGQKPTWVENHAKRVESLLQKDLFPYLGSQAIRTITAPELLVAIRRIERRALERAHRALQSSGQVFRYAIATGRSERNPAADLKGALPPHRGGHFAGPTDPKVLQILLRKMHSYTGTPAVCAALKLAPLVFARPGELRKALWADIDFDTAEWRYVSSKTKQPHLVPLSHQAIAILRDLHQITGRGKYVFPGARGNGRPMSDKALGAALQSMEILTHSELTPHGLRATARTILDEVLGFRPDIIEHQLAHVVKDPNGRAYNRTAHLKERQQMMQAWSDYCDKLRETEVIVMPRRA